MPIKARAQKSAQSESQHAAEEKCAARVRIICCRVVSVFTRSELQPVWVTLSARAGRRRRGFCCWHNRRRKIRDRSLDSGGNACAFHRLLLLPPHQNAKLDSGRLVGSDISVHFFLGTPALPSLYFCFTGGSGTCVRVNQETDPRAVTVLGGMKGLAPGQGPGCRAASEPPGQGPGVHFPGRR